MKYRVGVCETITRAYYVEADSPEDAEEKARSGELEGGRIIDSTIEAVEVDELHKVT